VRISFRVEDEGGNLVYQAAQGSVPLARSVGAPGGAPTRLNLASMLDLPVQRYGPHRVVIQLDDEEPEVWMLNVAPAAD